MYYEYVLLPRLKAEEHYIMPTRWQDWTFPAIFWVGALVLFLFGFRLIRYAMKASRRPDNTVSS